MIRSLGPRVRYYGVGLGAIFLLSSLGYFGVRRGLSSGKELIIASTEGTPETVQALLLGGAPIEVRDAWTYSTPLILASSVGNEEHAAGIVLVLLKHGADIEARNGNGSTALIMASERRHPKVVRVLIDRGANLDAVSAKGHSALFLAERKKDKEIAGMLRTAGAKDIDPKTAAWQQKGKPD